MSSDRQEEAAEALRIFRIHAPNLPVVAVFMIRQQDDKVRVFCLIQLFFTQTAIFEALNATNSFVFVLIILLSNELAIC